MNAEAAGFSKPYNNYTSLCIKHSSKQQLYRILFKFKKNKSKWKDTIYIQHTAQTERKLLIEEDVEILFLVFMVV